MPMIISVIRPISAVFMLMRHKGRSYGNALGNGIALAVKDGCKNLAVYVKNIPSRNLLGACINEGKCCSVKVYALCRAVCKSAVNNLYVIVVCGNVILAVRIVVCEILSGITCCKELCISIPLLCAFGNEAHLSEVFNHAVFLYRALNAARYRLNVELGCHILKSNTGSFEGEAVVARTVCLIRDGDRLRLGYAGKKLCVFKLGALVVNVKYNVGINFFGINRIVEVKLISEENVLADDVEAAFSFALCCYRHTESRAEDNNERKNQGYDFHLLFHFVFFPFCFCLFCCLDFTIPAVSRSPCFRHCPYRRDQELRTSLSRLPSETEALRALLRYTPSFHRSLSHTFLLFKFVI